MNDKKEKFARFEFKYLLDTVTYLEVRDFIESVGLTHDKTAPTNPYVVTSLYFDSFGLDDYYDKAGGFIDRKKARIRVYTNEFGDQDLHFEIKNKHDMFISKDRITVSKNEWQEIASGGFKKLPAVFGFHIFKEGRVPTVIVRYKREAFDDFFYDRVRLTFDSNIEAIKPEDMVNGNGLWYDAIPVSGAYVVMEIKFSDKLPWWFKFMMNKFDLSRTAYSKYGRSVDAIYQYDPLPR